VVLVNSRNRRWLLPALGTIATVLVLLCVGVLIVVRRIQPIVRDKAVAMLENRFQSAVELRNLQVSVTNGLSVHGDGLVLRYHGRTDVPPLLEIPAFSASMSWRGLFGRPFHIRNVHLQGLTIHIPPKQLRIKEPDSGRKTRDIPVLVDELTSDDAELVLTPYDPNKDVHVFDIHELVMHSVGLGHSSAFHAKLTNAAPPGEIHADGHFGPWQIEDPGQTPLSAQYTFQNADLSVFHGIAGILSSEGKFGGVLDNIAVEGHTDTPDFTVMIGGHPVPLRTDFQATVDGTNGNTLLHPVIATFGRSTLICSGGVVKVHGGKGREIDLDVTTDHARLEDLLRFAVKSPQPPLTGDVQLKTKFRLPTGAGDIADRLQLDGRFGIGGAEFASPEIRSKLEGLSRRGQGKPQDEDAGSAVSRLQGAFRLRDGRITFRRLTFGVAGATVELAGTYGLQTEQLDFHGTLHLDAKLSQITTGVKSFLLKPFDPFFRKNGETVLPIKITGTRDSPLFGLDFHHKDEKPDAEPGN
jgi:hypothetical protein